MSIAVLILLPLVLSLGFWQLDRGAQKRALESAYLDKLTELPTSAAELEDHAPFRRVALDGVFLEEIFLVDNQILNGRTGYWVVQSFADERAGKYLVNRGFVPGPKERTQLPEFRSPQGQVRLVGAIWPFTGLIPVLDDNTWPQEWPKRVQRLDVQRMAQLVEAEPIEIRLEPGQPGVAHAAPFATVLSDAKHRGYAATWFGLAIVLVIGFLVFGVKQARAATA